ncbi:Tripartite motif-containing protein 45, partial [Trachymyrmex cornetzi]
YFENNTDVLNLRDYKIVLLHMKQARERIQEFERLQKARHLLDAISLLNDLLADGSEIEILSLAEIIVRRLKKLGVTNTTADKENGMYSIYMKYWYKNTRLSASRLTHSGIYHCCTFCSSGGKKEIICGCRGTMPGGYKGCGHGHIGHPGFNHWSCCGSILRNGRCLIIRKTMHQFIL